ncbi:MAG: hypothetical protein HQK53_16990 [Oligoflexia bacterium]|nr:hypothetical protein [Oligoflexia bacterium]
MFFKNNRFLSDKTRLGVLFFYFLTCLACGKVVGVEMPNERLNSPSVTSPLSEVLPVVLEAMRSNLLQEEGLAIGVSDNVIQEAKDILAKLNLSKEYMLKILKKFSLSVTTVPSSTFFQDIRAKSIRGQWNYLHPNFYLPPDDEGDLLIAENINYFLTSVSDKNHFLEGTIPKSLSTPILPKIGIHIYRFDVINAEDDFSGDDIYCYFFVTDGVVPTGGVTSIYKGYRRNTSFFFSVPNRLLYPPKGNEGIIPHNHLIIDYGIVESDGDEIEDMQKISAAIIDLASVVYAKKGPMHGLSVAQLRKEVKNLADALLKLNKDDKLVTDSLYYKPQDFISLFADGGSVYEFTKIHKGKHLLSEWEYRINFRILRY